MINHISAAMIPRMLLFHRLNYVKRTLDQLISFIQLLLQLLLNIIIIFFLIY